ncbi:XRE family transcriptional regulator [Paraburkholderia dipogonis]|uniref:XRE family transcriptional regulator n=1 Tax=Paraburkholderia dipogonis TaxID=1211383 RepID=UPI0038BA95DD
MHYKPPQPEDIERLKKELGLHGTQMTELFGVAGNRAFRRYTSKSDDTKNKRELGAHMLFFAMARLELDTQTIERVLQRTRRVGATIDLDTDTPAPDGEQQP